VFFRQQIVNPIQQKEGFLFFLFTLLLRIVLSGFHHRHRRRYRYHSGQACLDIGLESINVSSLWT
jgi:hypothetical protein